MLGKRELLLVAVVVDVYGLTRFPGPPQAAELRPRARCRPGAPCRPRRPRGAHQCSALSRQVSAARIPGPHRAQPPVDRAAGSPGNAQAPGGPPDRRGGRGRPSAGAAESVT